MIAYKLVGKFFQQWFGCQAAVWPLGWCSIEHIMWEPKANCYKHKHSYTHTNQHAQLPITTCTCTFYVQLHTKGAFCLLADSAVGGMLMPSSSPTKEEPIVSTSPSLTFSGLASLSGCSFTLGGGEKVSDTHTYIIIKLSGV